MQNNDDFGDIFFEDDTAPQHNYRVQSETQKRPNKMYQRIGYTLVGIGLLTAGWFGYKFFGNSSPKTTQYCIATEEAPACGSQERVVYELKNALEPRPVPEHVSYIRNPAEPYTRVSEGIVLSPKEDEGQKAINVVFALRDNIADGIALMALGEDLLRSIKAFHSSGYRDYDEIVFMGLTSMFENDGFTIIENQTAAEIRFSRKDFEQLNIDEVAEENMFKLATSTYRPLEIGWNDNVLLQSLLDNPRPLLGTREALEYNLHWALLIGGTYIKDAPRLYPLNTFSSDNADLVIAITPRYVPDIVKTQALDEDFKKILEALKNSQYPYEKVVVLAYAPLADEYGNVEWGYMAYVLYDKTTVDKINFDSFDRTNIHKLALEWQSNSDAIFWY